MQALLSSDASAGELYDVMRQLLVRRPVLYQERRLTGAPEDSEYELPDRDSLRGPSLGETFSCMLHDVERDRRDDERQEQRQALAADDDHRDGPALLGARTAADGQRQHASDEGERCHQDGAEAVPARLEDGRAERHALSQQISRVVDLEDCVLRHDPEQDQHAERRVQVQRIR